MTNNSKYEFTDETRTAPDGTVLHRIRAKISFGMIIAGMLGGSVAAESNLEAAQ